VKLTAPSERCCSCHIAPPCSYCTDEAPTPDIEIVVSDALRDAPAELILEALPRATALEVAQLVENGHRIGVYFAPNPIRQTANTRRTPDAILSA